jgi:hypothetical protein
MNARLFIGEFQSVLGSRVHASRQECCETGKETSSPLQRALTWSMGISGNPLRLLFAKPEVCFQVSSRSRKCHSWKSWRADEWSGLTVPTKACAINLWVCAEYWLSFDLSGFLSFRQWIRKTPYEKEWLSVFRYCHYIYHSQLHSLQISNQFAFNYHKTEPYIHIGRVQRYSYPYYNTHWTFGNLFKASHAQQPCIIPLLHHLHHTTFWPPLHYHPALSLLPLVTPQKYG